LSDKEHRNARKYVYDVWENSYFPKYNEEAFNESGYQVIAETAAIGFDEIAVLIYKKLDFKKLEPTSMVGGYLPKDEFFAAYSGAVINSWIALKTFIMKRRHNNVQYYMKYFEKLYLDAVKFHKDNDIGETKFQRLRFQYLNPQNSKLQTN